MHAPRYGLLTRVLWFVAACMLAFEEWIWNHTSELLRRVGRLVPFRWIEQWVRRRTPLQALVLYVLPVLVILPLKAVALGVIARGHIAAGCEILFLAKVSGTAVFARLWQMTEPAITTYRWIRRGRDIFLRMRRRIYGWLHQQEAYRRTRALLEQTKRKLLFSRNSVSTGAAKQQRRLDRLRRSNFLRPQDIVAAHNIDFDRVSDRNLHPLLERG